MEQQPEKIKRVERHDKMPKGFEFLRAQIIEACKSRSEGLDIERAREFIRSKKLPVRDFVIIEDEDIPQLQKLFRGLYDMNRFIGGKVKGAYISELDLIIVHRDRTMEKQNGSMETEGNLVHELAHGGHAYSQYAETTDSLFRPRSGFNLPYNQENQGFAWGYFLEEGFADMMRGEYSEKNLPTEMKEKIQKEFENEEIEVNRDAVSEHFSGIDIEIDVKYLNLDPEGYVSYPLSAIAATGLQMLCKKQPKLKEVLIEARTDIEKLREIPRLINEIKPGLYSEIQKNALYNKADFARVQNIIKEAIQKSK